MTEQQAREEITDIDAFCELCCLKCTAASGDGYCPSECAVLQKARKLDFDKIIKCYARNDGDLNKVCRYIKRKR